MKGHVVKVFLDDVEMTELDKARGLVSRSGYIRSRIFETLAVGDSSESVTRPATRQVKAVGSSRSIRVPGGGDKVESSKPQDDRFCEHGVLKSEHNCRACDLAHSPLFKR
jgi:hypothetical protein